MKGPINMMIEMSKLDEFITWMQEYDTPSVEAVIAILIEKLIDDRGCDIEDIMNNIIIALYEKIEANRKKD